MPSVSVIIPTFNCAKYLPEAVESALNQSYQDFEIVIIDDGSTDKTNEIVECYAKSHNDKIQYIYQQNKGLACARNTGIKNSQGEYIALLDADDVWLPNRLAEQIAVIEKSKNVGLVHSNITFISEEGKLLSTPKRDEGSLCGNIFNALFTRNAHISCPTVLFRRECLESVGLFDENLAHLGCEDRELWLRIAKKYKIIYIDKVLAHYRIRKGSMCKNMPKMLEARYYVVNKFFPRDKPSPIVKNIALANIHKDIGDELLYAGQCQESRNHYLKAFSFWPFSLRLWINFIKTSLPVRKRHVS